jgi:hypothetical protein
MRCKVSSKKASAAVSLFTLIIILLFANQACAQVSGATLTGTVRDPSGGFIQTFQSLSKTLPPMLSAR